MRRQTPAPDTLRDGEAGTMTTWMLAMVIMILFLGGLTLDLWRALSERRAVASIVDAAAIAGSGGIDQGAFRATGTVQLAPELAEARAWANLAAQTDTDAITQTTVEATTTGIVVTATAPIELGLTGVLLAGQPPLQVTVAGASGPQFDT